MAELLRIGSSVATPLGLAGLVAALVAGSFWTWLKYRQKQLESLPESDRAGSLDAMLTRYKIDGAGLTKEQKFELIKQEMGHRAALPTLIVKVIWVGGAILALLATIAYVLKPDGGQGGEPKAASFRTQRLTIAAAGQPVKKTFRVVYRAEWDVSREASGAGGAAVLTVPATATRLETLAVQLPCHKQETIAPVQLVEGADVVVRVEAVRSPVPEPLPPAAFPVPGNVIPELKALAAQGRATAKQKANPEKAVLRYTNRTDVLCRLLLYSFAPEREGFPWRVIPSDPCAGEQVYNGFTESSGLFAVIARAEDGALAYLGAHDLYATSPVEVMLEIKDGRLHGSVR